MGRFPVISILDMFSGQFGLFVGYLLPGFLGSVGIAPFSPTVAEWLWGVPLGDSGIGPPLYAVRSATMIGMTLSCVRWIVIDHILAWTGVVAPALDFRLLEERLQSFTFLVEHDYRYFQFYFSTLLAVLWPTQFTA